MKQHLVLLALPDSAVRGPDVQSVRHHRLCLSQDCCSWKEAQSQQSAECEHCGDLVSLGSLHLGLLLC